MSQLVLYRQASQGFGVVGLLCCMSRSLGDPPLHLPTRVLGEAKDHTELRQYLSMSQYFQLGQFSYQS